MSKFSRYFLKRMFGCHRYPETMLAKQVLSSSILYLLMKNIIKFLPKISYLMGEIVKRTHFSLIFFLFFMIKTKISQKSQSQKKKTAISFGDDKYAGNKLEFYSDSTLHCILVMCFEQNKEKFLEKKNFYFVQIYLCSTSSNCKKIFSCL